MFKIAIECSFFLALTVGEISLTSAESNSTTVATKLVEIDEENEISALTFSPDGTRLATVEWTGSEVHVWNWVGESRIEKRLRIPEGSGLYTFQSGIKYSPDGTELAVAHLAQRSDDFAVTRIWNVSAGREVHKITDANRNGIRSSIDYSRNGRLFARTYDARPNDQSDQFFAYDAKSWNLSWSLHTAPFIPTAMALSPNGKFALIGGSSVRDNQANLELLIIDLTQRAVSRRIATLPHDREIRTVQWTSDGSRIIALLSPSSEVTGQDNLFIFDSATGAQVAFKKDTNGDISSIALTPDGKYMVESKEQSSISIWDSQHTVLLQELSIHPSHLTVSPDGRFLAVVSLAKMSIWKLK